MFTGSRLPKNLDNGLLREVFTLAERLAALGVLIELHWTPSHRGIVGNELADQVAKAHRPDQIDPDEYPPATQAGKRKKRKAEHERARKRREGKDGMAIPVEVDGDEEE